MWAALIQTVMVGLIRRSFDHEPTQWLDFDDGFGDNAQGNQDLAQKYVGHL